MGKTMGQRQKFAFYMSNIEHYCPLQAEEDRHTRPQNAFDEKKCFLRKATRLIIARTDRRSPLAFKVFDAYGAASRPEATLRASGYLFLSKGIMKRAGHERATHAQLMFDEETDRLGVKLFRELIDAPDDGTARDLSPEKSGSSVNLTPLLRYYGLPEPKHVGKQVFNVTFEDNVIVIDLKEYRNMKPDGEPTTTKVTAEDFDDDIPL